MSKIGKLPIILGSGVSATVQGSQVNVTGPKGNVNYTFPQGIEVSVTEGN